MKPDLGSDFTPSGAVNLPPSKSIANRLLLMSAFAASEGPLQRANEADDTQLMRQLLKSPNTTIDVGMAGTACRFLTAYFAIQQGRKIITGHPRMLERPVSVLVDALRELGASIEYTNKNGRLPLAIDGKALKGGRVKVPGDVSSQFISALLMIGPYLQNGLELEIIPPFYSAPYVRMTAELMKRSGADVKLEDTMYTVSPGEYKSVPKVVESDWSAAAFFYALIALSGRGTIVLNDLYRDSLQGDARCAELFTHFGIQTVFDDNGIVISCAENRLLPDCLKINCEDVPDLVQALACTCVGLRIPVHFTGVKSLRLKETDRIAALKNELKKLGAEITAGDDDLRINNFGTPEHFRIKTYNDHRMAMSFAPLSIVYPELEIENSEVVAKSFPEFWTELEGLKPSENQV